MKTHSIIPIFLPELGCPKQCVFCNQKYISGQQHVPDQQEVIATIERNLSTMQHEKHIELAFFGGSFTALSMTIQENFLKIAKPYLERKQIQNIRISTRPDAISEEILDMLKHYGVSIIELGVQSMDDEVLRQSGRGYHAHVVRTAATSINAKGFTLGMQMMIGLPGDSQEKSIMTAHEIVQMGAKGARIYPVLVFRDTDLALMFQQGKYEPLSIARAIILAADICEIFENAGIQIYKIGLHPSDFLHNGDLISGPWIPDFRQHVQSEVWRRRFLKAMKNHQYPLTEFRVHPSDLNAAIGPKRSNLIFFEQQGTRISIKNDSTITKGDFYAFYS